MPTISLLHFGLRRLMGALSDKELRVASRRGRSYVIRCAYIILLCNALLSTWFYLMGRINAGAVFGISRAAAVGTEVAREILLFQFVAVQLVAALMLSSSLGDELRRGTLGVLLTTPITSVHIVLGKLVGGLLQILPLLAIGLPALAVLRVLGGVPWNAVSAGFWITVTAALFAAAVSLLLSTYYRQPLQAISAGAVVYLVLFAGLPFVVMCLGALGVLKQTAIMPILDLTNPFRALNQILPQSQVSRLGGMGGVFAWQIHCLIMAGLALAASCLSVRRLRRVAAGGQPGAARKPRAVQRLCGSPVAWKDSRGDRLFRKRTILIGILVLAACGLLLATYRFRNVSFYIYQSYGMGGLWLIACLRLALSTAGGITREKESGAWPVLLTTPLGDRQILWGKAKAALRRNAVLLLSLFALEMCFLIPAISSWEILSLAAYVLGRLASIFFLLGAGLYFGVRLKTTTAAATATLVTFLCVNYSVAGRYSLFWAWLWSKLLLYLTYSAKAPGLNNYYVQLSHLALMGAALVLDVVLGLLLWRRARQNVRRYVF